MYRVLTFHSGIYTLLLAQTLCKYPCVFILQVVAKIYSSKLSGKLLRKKNKGYYSCVIILLWIFVVLVFASDWVTARDEFVVDNTSPLANLTAQISNLVVLFSGVTILLAVIISDTILVRIELSYAANQFICL